MSEVAPEPSSPWRWLPWLWGLGLPLLSGGILLVAHVAGWKSHTSLLSGTSPGSATTVIQGLVYVTAWFGFVILAPIAALSALCDRALKRLFDSRSGDRLAGPPPELGCGLEGNAPTKH